MMIYEKLAAVQAELKAPKGQYNSFGKYKYRSCEDILEAVKPLLAKNGLTMTVGDELVLISDRFYVKATATVYSMDGESLSNTAYAREPAEKKGMDEAQLTGTASSYARKYALNGLFCIDDTKDPDTDEYARRTGKAEPEQTAAPKEEPVPCCVCRKPVPMDFARKSAAANNGAVFCSGACRDKFNRLAATVKA